MFEYRLTEAKISNVDIANVNSISYPSNLIYVSVYTDHKYDLSDA